MTGSAFDLKKEAFPRGKVRPDSRSVKQTVGDFFVSTVNKSSSTNQLLSGADIAVQCLVNHGVDTIFAYPGGYSIPLHQALTRFRDKIRVILPRHEQGCGFGAQGYARSTGKVGVCMTTSGPGATNLITTIADAKMDNIPMVAITGQVGTSVIGTDAFQETPIVEVCRSVTKHHYLVTHIDDLTRVLREAFHVANTGRKGPVLVDLPKDIQMAQTVPDFEAEMNLPGYTLVRPLAQPEQLAQVAAAIRLAKRPIIYAGGGVIASEASPELKELVEKTGIPVTTTMPCLGGFPADDPNWLEMPGMHGNVAANFALNEADLLLAFGVRFDDRVTGRVSEFVKHGKIVHIDIDPSEINKIKEAHIPVISDIKYALAELNQIVEPPEKIGPWKEKIAKWKAAHPFHFDTSSKYILPQHAIQRLSELTADLDPIICTGVGQHQMWSAQYFQFRRPRRWLTSCGLGTMGFGLPSANGAQAANPDRMVINIEGDGSLMMNIQEMGTSYCEKLPVKVLLLNNMHLGMVVQWEDRFNAGNRAHTYLGPIDHPEALGEGNGVSPEKRYPDFVSVAKGFGWDARRIYKKEDLDAGLRELIESPGPFLLDVEVPYQEHVLPMIPAGATVDDLILE